MFIPGISPLGIYRKELIQEKKKVCTEMFHHYFNGKGMDNQGTPRNLDVRGMNG